MSLVSSFGWEFDDEEEAELVKQLHELQELGMVFDKEGHHFEEHKPAEFSDNWNEWVKENLEI